MWTAVIFCTPMKIWWRPYAQRMPDEDILYDLTELFRLFGDSTRLRILYVLFESELCVCDIAVLLGLTQSAISHQLRALKSAVWSNPAGKGRPYSTLWRMTT